VEQKVKVLIADPCADYRRLVAWQINDASDLELVGDTGSGSDAIHIAQEAKPDVVVLDICLAHLDGISVMRSLRKQRIGIPCILVSSFQRNSVFAEAFALGARSILLKPFSAETLMESVRSVKTPIEDCVRSPPGLEGAITKILAETGIPPHLKGYRYLKEAIVRTVSDRNICHAMTKLCYPLLARKFDTTSSRVERAMRHAIGLSWKCNDWNALRKLFGNAASKHDKTPTNSEWIATIADRVIEQLENTD